MIKKISIYFFTTIILFFIIELIAAGIYYQYYKDFMQSRFVSIELFSKIIHKLQNKKYEKLIEFMKYKDTDDDSYMCYTFNPQLHSKETIYHLSNAVNSTMVMFDETGKLLTFKTDEIGFRNPKNQSNKNVDFIFIGDSYTEGFYVPDEDTIAGQFRQNGYEVMNFGRGGSGPIFQLAVLKEYGSYVKTENVIWFVFGGNDYLNLREEKTTILQRYLFEENFTQNLFQNRLENSIILKDFLDNEFELSKTRMKNKLPLNYNQKYGETLDKLEIEMKESMLFYSVAEKILSETERIGSNLVIVFIDHAFYSNEVKDSTLNILKEFSYEKQIKLIEIERQNLIDNHDDYYDVKVGHFNSKGYHIITKNILDHLELNQ